MGYPLNLISAHLVYLCLPDLPGFPADPVLVFRYLDDDASGELTLEESPFNSTFQTHFIMISHLPNMKVNMHKIRYVKEIHRYVLICRHKPSYFHLMG